MTIKLTITKGFAPKTVLVDSAKTPQEILNEQEFDTTRGVWNLDGMTLYAEDLNTPFEELGAGERAYLTNVAKTDNA